MTTEFSVGAWVRVKVAISEDDLFWPIDVPHGTVGYISEISHIDNNIKWWVVSFQLEDNRTLCAKASCDELEHATAIDRLGKVADADH